MDAIDEAIVHSQAFANREPDAHLAQIELYMLCVIEALSELENRIRSAEKLLGYLGDQLHELKER